MFNVGDAINRARYEAGGGANAGFWSELEAALKEAMRLGFTSVEEMEHWWNQMPWNQLRPEQLASSKPQIKTPGQAFTVGGIAKVAPFPPEWESKIEEAGLGTITESEPRFNEADAYQRELPSIGELSGSLSLDQVQELRSRVSARASLGLNAGGPVGVNGHGGMVLGTGIGVTQTPNPTKSTLVGKGKVY